MKKWLIKVGNGYFLEEDESKITFILDNKIDSKRQAMKYDNKQTANVVAIRIGGNVELYDKKSKFKNKNFDKKTIEYFLVTKNSGFVLNYFKKHLKHQKINKTEQVKLKLKILSGVDDEILNYGIARMKSLEKVYDVTSNLGYYVTLLLALVATFSNSIYSLLNDTEIKGDMLLGMALSPLIMIGIVSSVILAFAGFLRERTQKCTFVRSILETSLKNDLN